MAASQTFQLSVPRRNSQCQQSGEVLTYGMAYYSFVYEGEEGAIREDFTEQGWLSGGEQRCRELGAVHWKSMIPPKLVKEEKALSYEERALELLREAVKKEDGASQSELFLLSLLLKRRKKILFKKDARRQGRLFHIYEVAGSKERFRIPQLALSEIEIQTIQESLKEKLVDR